VRRGPRSQERGSLNASMCVGARKAKCTTLAQAVTTRSGREPAWSPPGMSPVTHVLNVLARLTDAPVPPSVATALTVATAPLADPHRYDQLHEEEATHR
jgi:hypothetical protein